MERNNFKSLFYFGIACLEILLVMIYRFLFGFIMGSHDFSYYIHTQILFIFAFYHFIYHHKKEVKRINNSRMSKSYEKMFLMISSFNFLYLGYMIIFYYNYILFHDEIKDKISLIIFICEIYFLIQSFVLSIIFLVNVYKFFNTRIINYQIRRDLFNSEVNNANTEILVQTSNNANTEILVQPSNNSLRSKLKDIILPYRISNEEIIFLNKDDEECSICLEYVMENTILNFGLRTACNHYFHSDCLIDFMIKSNKCPNCRGSILLRYDY